LACAGLLSDQPIRCQILFRGSGGPRDYAARRISGAKLSFAFTSLLRLWLLPHQFSTFLL